MLKSKVICTVILTTFVTASQASNTPAKCAEALDVGNKLIAQYYEMFLHCTESSMPSQRFLTDNLRSFVNYPAKTTVGFAPRFTSNRKFFANMINTQTFKEMVARDEEELRKNVVKKLKYCQEVIIKENSIKDFYDREVDQTKI